MVSDPKPLLMVVLGPTGSGKSALAVALARRFGGEVLSCDSVAVYRGLEIGAAKPSMAERAAVPHHLLDIVDPPEAMTAGDWARAARRVAAETVERGALPIVAGGTGLYLRAMLEGLAPLPPRCPELRARLLASARRRSEGYLHRLLARLDKSAAGRIHGKDEPKLVRALEIRLLGGNAPVSRDPLRGFRVVRLGLAPEREQLYARLNLRVKRMFAAGLVEETRGLQARWGTEAQALGALGYREAAAVLAGRLSLDDATAQVAQGHRNYAKRQKTWFRKEPEVRWLHGFGEKAAVVDEAAKVVKAALGRPGESG